MVSTSHDARLQPLGHHIADKSLLHALSIVICGLVFRPDLRVVGRLVIGRSGVLCRSLCELVTPQFSVRYVLTATKHLSGSQVINFSKTRSQRSNG
jgi:hypothetical protein